MTQQFDEILERVTRVFRSELGQPALSLAPETTAETIDGWDSLSHMGLISAVETEFDIRFKLPEILKFQNVGDMCRAIEKRSGA